MQLTPIYKFKKRELTDSPPDITANNSNWDVLETNLKSHGDSIASQSKQIDVLQEKNFQDRGISKDGNTANLVGQYRFSSGAKNLPNGTGVLFVLPFDNVSIKQIALIFDGNRTFERQCLVGTWTDWENKIGNALGEYLPTTIKDVFNLPIGKWFGVDLTNSPRDGYLYYDVVGGNNPKFRKITSKSFFINQNWENTKNNDVWTGWEDKIGNLQENKLDKVILKPDSTKVTDCIETGIYKCPKWVGFPQYPLEDGQGILLVTFYTKNKNDNNSWIQYEFLSPHTRKRYVASLVNEVTLSSWEELATTSKINILATDFKNGWSNFQGHQATKLNKIGNIVFLTGYVNVGITTQGTVIFENIPTQFLPPNSQAIISGNFNIRVSGNSITIHQYNGGNVANDCLNGIYWEV